MKPTITLPTALLLAPLAALHAVEHSGDDKCHQRAIRFGKFTLKP